MDISSKNSPPKSVVRLSNIIIICAILGTALIVFYSFMAIMKPGEYTIYIGSKPIRNFFIYTFAFSVIVLLFFLIILRLNVTLKANISLVVITILATVYIINLFYSFSEVSIDDLRMKKAKEMGVNYDKRSKFEFINDLRKNKIAAYSYIPNYDVYSTFIPSADFSSDTNYVCPVGGISDVTTVLGNENGYCATYKSDEHGFNNPKDLYHSDSVDIILVGDSFVEGYSVNSDENIGAILRESGYKTISLGKCGSGSLIFFVALKEYAVYLRPRIVLWVSHYENDLYDLNRESKSTLLMKYYIDDNFTQNLIRKQGKIDSVLIELTNSEYEKEKAYIASGEKNQNNLLKQLATVKGLIRLFNVSVSPTKYTPLYKSLLAKSDSLVSSWGGKLIFVYLPVNFTNNSIGVDYGDDKTIFKMAKNLNIPLIDIRKHVFEKTKDPLSFFPFRTIGHYNAEGYREVGKAIVNYLNNNYSLKRHFSNNK